MSSLLKEPDGRESVVPLDPAHLSLLFPEAQDTPLIWQHCNQHYLVEKGNCSEATHPGVFQMLNFFKPIIHKGLLLVTPGITSENGTKRISYQQVLMQGFKAHNVHQ